MRELKREIWPHKICIKEQANQRLNEIEIWLGLRLGIFKNRWNLVQHYESVDFYFRDKQDAIMFALKWS